MICIGAVVVTPKLDKRFSAKVKPISNRFLPEALAISGFSREQTPAPPFEDAAEVMAAFGDWIAAVSNDRRIFISDNNGFDWMFVAWYFHHLLGDNPFGYSSMNLGSLYKGMAKDVRKNFKHLRRTVHTDDPLDDAVGNAEALVQMAGEMGLKIDLK